jgi:VWFA-related protein
MRLCTLVTVACLANCPAVAQAPTLRTTSRLVQVNVIVHDSKGKPVRDLTEDDFVVLDEGKPCRVAFFQMAEDRANAATAVIPLHSLTLDNRNSQAQRPPAATIILVDSLNMGGADDLVYVKRELPTFLKSLQPGDPVALYHLAGPNVRIIHEFSENTESLIRSAERGSGEVNQWLGSGAGDRTTTRAEAHVKAEWTLAAIEAIAQHVASLPGRKTLVWVSGAFPIDIGFDHTENLAGGVSHPQNGDLESY